MKQYRLSLLCYLTLLVGVAQAQPPANHHVGHYGNSDGVCLFEDGKFLLYGYATAIFGRYTINDSKIQFYPDRRDQFEAYGTKNQEIEANQSRFRFMGFEEGDTFVQFDQDSTFRVFNTDANCFSYPYTTTRTQPTKDIALLLQSEEAESFQTFYFANSTGYNDVVLVYNKVDELYNDFVGQLEGNVLKLSNIGGADGYSKQEEDREWEDILAWKIQYEEMIVALDSSYTDERTQITYAKIKAQKAGEQASFDKPLAHSPVFQVACEGSLELPTTNTENAYYEEAPFAVDKPDGFYWVKELNQEIYAETRLEDLAVITAVDIQSAKYEITPQGQPVISINLTEEGKAKIAAFTAAHINQHMAVVVHKMVLSIPRIMEPISTGNLQIAGNFTVEEAQTIARRLNGVK